MNSTTANNATANSETSNESIDNEITYEIPAHDEVVPESALVKNARIIALGYKAGSGKDTLGAYLTRQYGYTRIAFGDKVKETAAAALGFSEEQMHGDAKTKVDPYWGITPAEVYQVVGTEFGRELMAQKFPDAFGNKDIWIRSALRPVEENPTGRYVITDCRFPNEGDAVRERGGTVCNVFTSRELRKERLGGDLRDPNHPSETGLDGYEFDYQINNNGPKKMLREAGDTLIADLLGLTDRRPPGNLMQMQKNKALEGAGIPTGFVAA